MKFRSSVFVRGVVQRRARPRQVGGDVRRAGSNFAAKVLAMQAGQQDALCDCRAGRSLTARRTGGKSALALPA
jgi:hypothetical protein